MPSPPPMTRTRWMLLAAGLPVVLAVITLAGYGWTNRTVIFLATQTQAVSSVGFSVPPARGRVQVSSTNGDLTLRPGTGGRVRVRGRLSSSFARPLFSYRSGPDGLVLDPQCRVPAGTCSLNLSVFVPRGLPVSATDSFGTLDAQRLSGTIGLSDNSGDLTASRLGGNVHLTDSFGTLSASHLAGSIRLDNSSGDIQAAGVVGNTWLQDSFGAVTVTGLAATDVVAGNSSGDISLTFATVPRRVDVTDSFGSITLVLPPGAATYRVQTRDSFGSETVSVPQSPSASHIINARNSSGDITIVTRNAPVHPARPS